MRVLETYTKKYIHLFCVVLFRAEHWICIPTSTFLWRHILPWQIFINWMKIGDTKLYFYFFSYLSSVLFSSRPCPEKWRIIKNSFYKYFGWKMMIYIQYFTRIPKYIFFWCSITGEKWIKKVWEEHKYWKQ